MEVEEIQAQQGVDLQGAEAIEVKIKSWLEAVRMAMTNLFAGERLLSDNVFASSDSIIPSCSIQRVKDLGNTTMNFATLLCRRLNIKELVTNVPVYSGASDVSGGGLALMFRRWATKKARGSSKNGRDSLPKNLGVKKFGGERVIPGNIIVRQRGTRFHPGNYVGIGKDHTLFALKEGNVKFERNKLTGRKWVHVLPKEGHVIHPVYSEAATPGLKAAIV